MLSFMCEVYIIPNEAGKPSIYKSKQSLSLRWELAHRLTDDERRLKSDNVQAVIDAFVASRLDHCDSFCVGVDLSSRVSGGCST